MSPPRHRRGPAAPAGGRGYPRSARVNEVLREVLAETLERLADDDERLAMLTVTAVDADPDLRHARVLFASLTEAAEAGLGDARVRLQGEIGHQIRLKRTPQLSFEVDPAVSAGQRVEDILRRLRDEDTEGDGTEGDGTEGDGKGGGP